MSGPATKRRDAPPALLGPDDAPPVEIVNAEGAAHMLLVCDHASNAMPASLDGLGLEPWQRELHVAWDIGAADVARRLARRFDAKLILAAYSRLVVDCNRAPGAAASILAESDGVPVPGNRDLSDAETRTRIDEIYRPYHDAIAGALDDFDRRGIRPALISIHSFTPVFEGYERPWDVGVLHNRDSRLARLLIEELRRDPALTVGDNRPYSARDMFGATMDVHGEERDVAHVLVEIRQDLIDTHHGAEDWAGRLAAALNAVVAGHPAIGRVNRSKGESS